MSKVSVIVPVYNVEQYLPKCIESIQNQSEKDIEIILVDDGSSDDSGAICDRYAKDDSRIHVIHQENGGQGVARNTGLANATGEYVFFMDSDDWIDPDLIKETYKAACEYNADMVLFDLQAIDADGNFVYRTDQKIPKNTLLSAKNCKELLLTDPSPCNKIMKREWLLENDFTFPGVWYEDLIAITKIDAFVQNAVYIADKPYYNYFLRANSSLRNGDPQKTTDARIFAVQSILNAYREKDLSEYYSEQLAWIALFHGFFLPAREILSFTDSPAPYIHQLRENLDAYTLNPYQNPYFSRLSKREKMIFKLLYSENYSAIKFFFKMNSILKK